jgi:hypothetical protein
VKVHERVLSWGSGFSSETQVSRERGCDNNGEVLTG